MFGSVGIWEILLLIGVIAILFGGKKLPQLGKGLGEGITNFKNSLKKTETEETNEEKSENAKDN
jgi:sec-independent protein translocase protein TatA